MKKEQLYFPQGVKGTVVNQTFISFNIGSLETTFTVPWNKISTVYI